MITMKDIIREGHPTLSKVASEVAIPLSKEDVQLMKEIGQRLLRQIWTCVCGLQEPAENYERFSILV